ncbi:MAG: PKD domain-containing protein [Gemmatimonadota bacterium]
MRRVYAVALAAALTACDPWVSPTGLDRDPLLVRTEAHRHIPGTYSTKVVRSRTGTGHAVSAPLPVWAARSEWDWLVLFDGEAIRSVVAAGPGARSTLAVASDGASTKAALQIALDGAGDVRLELVYLDLGGGYRTVAPSPIAAASFVAGDWYVLDAGINLSAAWLGLTHFHSGATLASVVEPRAGSDAGPLSTAVVTVSADVGDDVGLGLATLPALARIQTVALGDGSRGPLPSGGAAVSGLDPNGAGVDHYWPYDEGAGSTVADVVGGSPLTYGGSHGADWYWVGGRNPSWDFNSGYPTGSTAVGDVVVENGVLKLHRYGADGRGTVRLNEETRSLGLWWDELHLILGTDTDEDDQYLNNAHPYSGFAAALRTDVGASPPPGRDLIAWSITNEKAGPVFQFQADVGSTGLVLVGRENLVDPVGNGPFHVRIMGLGSTVQVDFIRLRSASAPLDQDWQGGFASTGWTQALLEAPHFGLRLSHKNPGPTVYTPGRYAYYEDLNSRYVGLWTKTVVPGPGNQPPTASFTSGCTDLDCAFADGSTDVDGTVVGWAWDFGDGGTSTAQSPAHIYAAAGTYSVTLTVTDDDGATDAVVQTVSPTPANQAPTAAFTSACTDLDCTFTDGSTDVDGTVVSWDWAFGDGGTSTAQNPTHTYAGAGTYSVSLTVTDDDGATHAVTQSVSPTPANQAPTAAFTSACTDLDCTFTDGSTDVDGTVVAWSWDFGDGGTSAAQSPTHTYGAAGTYSVTLMATDDDGASHAVVQTVSPTPANQAPTAAFTSACTDLDCTFTDGSTDVDGTVVAWSWAFGDGGTSAAQNPTHTYPAAGTYSVTLTVTDDDGATHAVVQTVSPTPANQAPTAAFTSACTDLDCTFTDGSTDVDGTVVSWDWAFGDGATATAQNPTHTYPGAGAYSVTLMVTDDDGATHAVVQSVTPTAPNQAPTAAFTSACTDLDCTFTDGSTDVDGAVVSWAWDFGDGGTSTAQNPAHTYAVAGTYSVTLTVTDDDGATHAVVQSVSPTAPNQAPTAAFTSACTALDCTFTDGSVDVDGAVVMWAWDFGDGGTSTAQNPAHIYAAAGTYSVSLTVTDDDGATHAVVQSVTPTAPNQAPTAAFTFGCTALNCTFTDGSTDVDGTVVAWSWAFGDGATATIQNPSHTYGAAGTYSVTLLVTDDDGATHAVVQTVSPTPANQAPTAAFTSACTDLDCTFTDGSTDVDGTVVAWIWAFGDGGTSTAQSPTYTYAAAGTYSVSLTVTDDDGATHTLVQTVSPTPANQAPTAAFTSSCTDLDCTFTDGSTDVDGTVVAWSWTFGDGGTSTAQSPTHTYSAAGTYSVTLMVTDDDGATHAVVQSVTPTAPNQAPTAAFASACTDLDCTFTDGSTDVDGAVVSWAWDFGDGGTSTAQNPAHTYAVAGTYSVSLMVTDDGGATHAVVQSVSPTPPNQAPTAAFTSACTDLDCTFTDGSTDADGTVVAWSWAFGDGATATVQNPSHTYAAAGTYSVSLTVTDDDGATHTVVQSASPTAPNQAPTAAFTFGCTALDCTFADGSTDVDGTVVAWSWAFGDGATATVQNPSHTYAAAGTYSVSLTVTDDDGASHAVVQSVSPTAPNQAPTAAFTFGCTALDCTFTDGSTDVDGTVVAWSWAFGDGATATVQNPSHTYAAAGTYSVSLMVTDDGGATHAVVQSVSSTAPNQAPTAAFTSACTDLDCTFTDGSTDVDGTVVAWSWAFGDGATATVQNPSHTYAAAGTYSVSLTVTDDDGATHAVVQSVSPTPTNQAPTAAFTSACTDLDCTFTDGSTDVDGTVVAWSWDFGDGGTSATQSPTHTYGAAGTYSVTLMVTDDDGASHAVVQSVSPTPPNQAPTAAFTFGCTALDCTFTDGSVDVDGAVVIWAWDFGDGGTSTAQNPAHTYAVAGTYSVSLTVTDDDGATHAVVQSVSPTAPNQAPTAAFTSACTDLDCTFTDGSTDVDGTVVVWAWDFGDGGTSTAQNPTHTYAGAGTYSVSLTVTDDDGATHAVVQSVSPTAPNQAPTARFNRQCGLSDCTFSDRSSDPDGTVVAWSWDFGDGTASSLQNPQHTFLAPGNYFVTLIVTDDDGATGTRVDDILCTQRPNGLRCR